MTSTTLYSSASCIPLIKSPSLRVPEKITLPPFHPLPPDLEVYFAYNFSLEDYVLSSDSPKSATISQLHQRHTSFLLLRKEREERERKEKLRKVAPGWDEDEGGKGVLVPNVVGSTVLKKTAGGGLAGAVSDQPIHEPSQKGPMENLVEHLAQLDAAISGESFNERDRRNSTTKATVIPPPPRMVPDHSHEMGSFGPSPLSSQQEGLL